MGGLRARTHQHDHPVGIFGAVVLKQLVPAARQPGESIHGLLDNIGAVAIVPVDRFPCLEKDIRVLRRSPDHGIVGG